MIFNLKTRVIGLGCVCACVFSPLRAEDYPFQNESLPVEERVQDLVSRMTLDEKVALLVGYENFNLKPLERLGVPMIRMADGPLGIASWNTYGSGTAFPAALMIAASWDRSLAAETGAFFGEEWRARGLHLCLAPGMNIYRASKDARNFEYYGEDPYLTAEMAVSFIQGLQKQGVMATIKHYVGNDQEFDRYQVSTEVSERALREIYLYPFEMAVKKANVMSVMSGYNLLNGQYAAENKWALDVLRNEWGFKGMYMSDWEATHSTEASMLNGLDLEMGSQKYYTPEVLMPLIENGTIPLSVIDQRVSNIYRACITFGFLDREQKDSSIPVENKAANDAALRGAEAGMVLLKNNGILPLNDSVKRIAVVGPTAHPTTHWQNVVYGGGGSSKVIPWYTVSVLEGIRNRYPNAEITYQEGISNRFKTDLFKSAKFENKAGKPTLSVAYYKGDGWKKEDLAFTTEDATLNYEWSWGNRPGSDFSDRWSARWFGYVNPIKDDTLTFLVDAQGGYRLWLNDKVAIDALESGSFHFGEAKLPVKKGERVAVTMEYATNNSYPAELRLGYLYNSDLDFTPVVEEAKNADIVLFCGGFDASLELEGRDRPFELPFGQARLIRELGDANPNTVVVLHGGGGMEMQSWMNSVAAIVHAFYPGLEGGNAIASILIGEVNPSGKLPFSIEKRWEDSPAYGNYDETRAERKIYYNEGIFTGYRGYDKKKIEPLFPFGFGLSYTHFSYDNLTISSTTERPLRFEVSFRITNTGDREGAEVAQLYVRDVKSKEVRPLKELKGFEKVFLQPGQSTDVTISLGEEAFHYFSEKAGDWVLESGKFEILVGGSSKSLPLKGFVKIK